MLFLKNQIKISNKDEKCNFKFFKKNRQMKNKNKLKERKIGILRKRKRKIKNDKYF
jgi:hypothetical protein